MANTTWNPAAKGTNITLSNTNHTASDTSFGDNGKVLGTPASHSTGKWYLEYPSLTEGNAFLVGFGLATITLNDNSLTGMIGLDQGGTHHSNGSTVATGLGAWPAGAHRLGIALDFTNGKAWYRIDGGNWNNDVIANQNPASNVGGSSLFSVSGTFFPAAFLQNLAANSLTLNAGDTAFVDTMPTGFTAWDSTPAPVPRSSAVVLS